MIKNILLKKACHFLFLLVGFLSFAQSVPPPPETPESGDIGVYPASPIDSYILVLFLVAIFIITAMAVKRKKILE
jgi:hypothetical protein